MLKRFVLSLALVLGLAFAAGPAAAQDGSVSDTYSADDLVETGSSSARSRRGSPRSSSAP
jgi:hypothetical protein